MQEITPPEPQQYQPSIDRKVKDWKMWGKMWCKTDFSGFFQDPLDELIYKYQKLIQ